MLIVEKSTTADNRSSVVFWSPPGRPNRPTGSDLTASSIPTIGRARSTAWSMRNSICSPSSKLQRSGKCSSPPGPLDQDVALRTRPWHDSAHQVASRPLRERAAAVAAHGLGSQPDLVVRIPRSAELVFFRNGTPRSSAKRSPKAIPRRNRPPWTALRSRPMPHATTS